MKKNSILARVRAQGYETVEDFMYYLGCDNYSEMMETLDYLESTAEFKKHGTNYGGGRASR